MKHPPGASGEGKKLPEVVVSPGTFQKPEINGRYAREPLSGFWDHFLYYAFGIGKTTADGWDIRAGTLSGYQIYGGTAPLPGGIGKGAQVAKGINNLAKNAKKMSPTI